MSIREFLNTRGINSGKISGDRMAIDVNSTMSLSYTENGSVLLGCVGTGIITPELLNNYIDVDGKLTKSILGDKLIISSIDLENWVINDYYDKIYIDNLISNYYTKLQVNNLLDDYVLISYLTSNYYSSSDIDTTLLDYVQFGYLDKYYFTITDIVLNYYDKTAVDLLFYNKVQSDARFINVDKIGVASGVCPLDAGGKVQIGYLPSAIMTYEGLFNATTNIPILNQPNDNILYNSGAVFIVQNTIDPSIWNGITLRNGDWLILNNLGYWEKSENTDDLIISFNGRVGAVSSIASDYTTWFYQKSETYTKGEVDNLLLDYPTLNYLTTNFYNKTEINSIIYTKLQIDAMLNNYVESSYLTTNYYQKSSLYTKGETDSLLSNYVLSSVLTNYYTSLQCDGLFYTKTYIGNNFYTKTNIDTLLTGYVTSTYLTSNYYTQTQSNANYYTKTYINDNCIFNTGAQSIAGVKTFTNGVVISTNDKPMLSLINSANIAENQFWSFQNLSNVTNPYFFGDMRFGNADDDTFKARFSIFKVSATENRFAIGLSSTGGLMDFLLFYNNAGIGRIDSNYQLKLLSGGTTITPVNSIDIANKAYCDTKLNLSGGTMTGLLVLSADPSVSMNPVTLNYLQTNYATTTTNNSNYVSLTTTQNITGEKTFKNKILQTTPINGLITSVYTGTETNINGYTFQSSSTAAMPYYYFDIMNSIDGTHIFRTSVWKTDSITNRVAFTLTSSGAHSDLADFLIMTRGAINKIEMVYPTYLLAGGTTITPVNSTDIANKSYCDNNFARLAVENTFTLNNIFAKTGLNDGIKISGNFTNYPATTNGSEIFNDITMGGDQALCLVGNKTSGGRQVRIFDNAFVNGRLTTITGTISTTPTNNQDIVNKFYCDNNFYTKTYADNNYVTIGTTQTITSEKTFSSTASFTGTMYLGASSQFNINATGRLLLLGQEDIYILCQNNNGLVRIGSEGGGANTGSLLIYRSCAIGLGAPGYRGNLYINNGVFEQWDSEQSILVNRFRNSYNESAYAQIITDYSLNNNGDGRYLRRVSVERNGLNDIRIYNLLSDGTNALLTYDETQRIGGNITRYMRNSNVMLDQHRVISAVNVIPPLSAYAPNGSFKWLPLEVRRNINAGGGIYNNYVSYVYKMFSYDVYNRTNYKRVDVKSMCSNSAVNYYRVNYYSFMSYGDSIINNITNIRFGISSRPPNLSTGATGTLWYGQYDATTSLPPQFNYLTRFYKSGSYYKANTNLSSDNANPVSINLLETKKYIYTCSWSYDYSLGYQTIFVATNVLDYDTHTSIFYDAIYLTPYNNNGGFLLCTDVSPMICVTNEAQGSYLEILTQIDPILLSVMIGTSQGVSNAINVFDP